MATDQVVLELSFDNLGRDGWLCHGRICHGRIFTAWGDTKEEAEKRYMTFFGEAEKKTEEEYRRRLKSQLAHEKAVRNMPKNKILWGDMNVQRVMDLREQGKTLQEIATLFGRSRERIRQVIAKAERQLARRTYRERKLLNIDLSDIVRPL